jgi:hypothetical protein
MWILIALISAILLNGGGCPGSSKEEDQETTSSKTSTTRSIRSTKPAGPVKNTNINTQPNPPVIKNPSNPPVHPKKASIKNPNLNAANHHPSLNAKKRPIIIKNQPKANDPVIPNIVKPLSIRSKNDPTTISNPVPTPKSPSLLPSITKSNASGRTGDNLSDKKSSPDQPNKKKPKKDDEVKPKQNRKPLIHNEKPADAFISGIPATKNSDDIKIPETLFNPMDIKSDSSDLNPEEAKQLSDDFLEHAFQEAEKKINDFHQNQMEASNPTKHTIKPKKPSVSSSADDLETFFSSSQPIKTFSYKKKKGNSKKSESLLNEEAEKSVNAVTKNSDEFPFDAHIENILKNFDDQSQDSNKAIDENLKNSANDNLKPQMALSLTGHSQEPKAPSSKKADDFKEPKLSQEPQAASSLTRADDSKKPKLSQESQAASSLKEKSLFDDSDSQPNGSKSTKSPSLISKGSPQSKNVSSKTVDSEPNLEISKNPSQKGPSKKGASTKDKSATEIPDLSDGKKPPSNKADSADEKEINPISDATIAESQGKKASIVPPSKRKPRKLLEDIEDNKVKLKERKEPQERAKPKETNPLLEAMKKGAAIIRRCVKSSDSSCESDDDEEYWRNA